VSFHRAPVIPGATRNLFGKAKQWASASAYRLKAGLDCCVETADSMKIKRHGLYTIRTRGTGIPYTQMREPTPRS